MDIHQDQPWVPRFPDADGGLAVIRALHGKTDGRQQFHQPVPVLKLVVNDQDSGTYGAGMRADHTTRNAVLNGDSGVAKFERNLKAENRAAARAAGNRDVAAHEPGTTAANGEPQTGSLLAVDATARLA